MSPSSDLWGSLCLVCYLLSQRSTEVGDGEAGGRAAHVHKDHGASDKREGVDHEPGGVPLRHEWPYVGELADRLDHSRRKRQQLLVELEARPPLPCTTASPLHRARRH